MNQVPTALPQLPMPLPLRRVLARIAAAPIPGRADFCLIHLALGRSIVCVATAHSTADGQRQVRALGRAYRIRPGDGLSTVAQVLATGRASLRRRIPVDAVAVGDAVDTLHHRLGPRSALVVPVLRQSHAIGAVSLCYAASGRAYSARDLPAARELAARVAQVLLFAGYADARLRPATGRARQGTTVRRRVAARN
jgi:GAF domain-containing protein